MILADTSVVIDNATLAHIENLFAAANRLAGLGLVPLTEAEVQAEIEAARRERRAADGDNPASE